MEGEKRNKCIVSRAWAAIVDDSLGRDMNWFGRKDGRRTKQNLEPKIAICKLRLSCIVHGIITGYTLKNSIISIINFKVVFFSCC